MLKALKKCFFCHELETYLGSSSSLNIANASVSLEDIRLQYNVCIEKKSLYRSEADLKLLNSRSRVWNMTRILLMQYEES